MVSCSRSDKYLHPKHVRAKKGQRVFRFTYFEKGRKHKKEIRSNSPMKLSTATSYLKNIKWLNHGVQPPKICARRVK